MILLAAACLLNWLETLVELNFIPHISLTLKKYRLKNTIQALLDLFDPLL